MSAYMLYAQYRRPQIERMFKGISTSKASTLMAIEWRDELSREDPDLKKRFEMAHKRLRAAYDRDMRRYISTGGAAKWARKSFYDANISSTVESMLIDVGRKPTVAKLEAIETQLQEELAELFEESAQTDKYGYKTIRLSKKAKQEKDELMAGMHVVGKMKEEARKLQEEARKSRKSRKSRTL